MANERLDAEIKAIYVGSKGRYGRPKITRELHHLGHRVR